MFRRLQGRGILPYFLTTSTGGEQVVAEVSGGPVPTSQRKYIPIKLLSTKMTTTKHHYQQTPSQINDTSPRPSNTKKHQQDDMLMDMNLNHLFVIDQISNALMFDQGALAFTFYLINI